MQTQSIENNLISFLLMESGYILAFYIRNLIFKNDRFIWLYSTKNLVFEYHYQFRSLPLFKNFFNTHRVPFSQTFFVKYAKNITNVSSSSILSSHSTRNKIVYLNYISKKNILPFFLFSFSFFQGMNIFK